MWWSKGRAAGSGRLNVPPKSPAMRRALANYTVGMDFTEEVSFSGNSLKKLGW